MYVTQLKLHGWNSQRNCSSVAISKSKPGLALNHHSTLDKRYPGQDMLYLHSIEELP